LRVTEIELVMGRVGVNVTGFAFLHIFNRKRAGRCSEEHLPASLPGGMPGWFAGETPTPLRQAEAGTMPQKDTGRLSHPLTN
jgi:hypothetical protein